MQDFSFTLDPMAAQLGEPPFKAVFVARGPTQACWDIRDGRNLRVGQARTRRGARAALRALYAGPGSAAAPGGALLAGVMV